MSEDTYIVGRIERRLAEDERTHELGVHAEIHEDTIVLSGEVAGEDRRRLVAEVAGEVATEVAAEEARTVGRPGPARLAIRNRVSVTDVRPPREAGA
jgi:hypothetical protein